jgi:hypothetical protein
MMAASQKIVHPAFIDRASHIFQPSHNAIAGLRAD